VFSAFIDSLLPFAEKVERLAPSMTGETRPNPEYPWRPTPSGAVLVPAQFDFKEFDPADIKLIQLVSLIDKLVLVHE
jgi:hypothetical protein